jgi:hypothetical protein
MGQQVKAAVGINEIRVITDKSYFSVQGIVDNQSECMTPLIANLIH